MRHGVEPEAGGTVALLEGGDHRQALRRSDHQGNPHIRESRIYRINGGICLVLT